LSSQLRADIRFANGLPSSGSLLRAFQEIDKKFDGSIPLLLRVNWSKAKEPTPGELLAAVEAAHHSLDGRSIISPAISLATIYQTLPERDRDPALLMKLMAKLPDQRARLFVDNEARQALVMSRCQDAGSHPIEDMITDIQSDLLELETQHPGFRLRVTESLLTSMRVGNRVVLDLMKSLFMAVPITVVVLVLALRSVRAGLVALIPNIFSMAALAATMVLVDQPLMVAGSAVFCMCFGIAVDDTIHSLTGFKRHYKPGSSTARAITETYREVGDAVISTTVILVAGLAVVMLGQTASTRIFGAMFCLGMVWSVVGDLVILPPIIACFPPKRQANFKQRKPLAATSATANQDAADEI
jgi:predicted RND superfamily exporter protein